MCVCMRVRVCNYTGGIIWFISLCVASDTPEAEVEEVLGSLKLRILRMFKWARSEVRIY